MNNKNNTSDILVIGAGMAGIESSLTLAKSDRKVHLIEKTSYTGGKSIKFEEVFSNMECSTCMISPKQQDLLQNKNINLIMLATVEDIQGSPGGFTVKIHKKPRYVDMQNCIGCAECFNPCPVNVPNEFEEGLSKRKAIYVPCTGALPNVPCIDTNNCLRFQGKDCQACQDACMFEAIDFNQKDETIELNVADIIVATGYELYDPTNIPQYGYKKISDVYTSLEFERLYASNGPTQGKIQLKNGKTPHSVAIIHCIGREQQGYCSSVCCMYSLKFSHYLKSKIPDIQISELYTDLCIPGKSHQQFYEKIKKTGTTLIRATDITVTQQEKKIAITHTDEQGKKTNIVVDMVILSPAIVPHTDAQKLASTLGITCDDFGFYKEENQNISSVVTPTPGVFIAGCSQGPKNIQETISQANAAVGKILSASQDGINE